MDPELGSATASGGSRSSVVAPSRRSDPGAVLGALAALPIFLLVAYLINRWLADGQADWLIWLTLGLGLSCVFGVAMRHNLLGGSILIIAWLVWLPSLVIGPLFAPDRASAPSPSAGAADVVPSDGPPAVGQRPADAAACAAFEFVTQTYINGKITEGEAATMWANAAEQAVSPDLRSALTAFASSFAAGGDPSPRIVRAYC